MNAHTDIIAAPGRVYTAIAAVAKDISAEGIGKGRKNTQQGYSFRGIDDVMNALSPILARHGICILPRVTERVVQERETQRGGVLFYVTVKVEFTVHADDGSSVAGSTYGEAMDSADKATNKAMSAAYKYFAFQTFCIPVEGTPDADGDTPEPVRPRESARDRAARESDANGGIHPNNMPDADDFDAAATAIRISDLLKLATTKEDIGRAWNVETRADRARVKAADPKIYKTLTDALEFETQRVTGGDKPSPQADAVLDDDVPF